MARANRRAASSVSISAIGFDYPLVPRALSKLDGSGGRRRKDWIRAEQAQRGQVDDDLARRQADDVAVRARHTLDQKGPDTLGGVCAGLVQALAGPGVRCHLRAARAPQ